MEKARFEATAKTETISGSWGTMPLAGRQLSSGFFLFPRTIALPTTLLFITRTPHSEDRLFSSYSKESLRKKAPKNNQDAHDKHARMRNLHVPKGAHTCQKGRDNRSVEGETEADSGHLALDSLKTVKGCD